VPSATAAYHFFQRKKNTMKELRRRDGRRPSGGSGSSGESKRLVGREHERRPEKIHP